ncbi:MAG: hypothetical protein KTR25_00595 [Myxococcales bacterium]|nr:hypothetical protein [Myxococcales bacterium]
MGILDFIKPKSALEKAAQQVREVYAQPDYRRTAMEKLLEIGSTEAYDALLRRFTVNANGQIADEQEKKDLVDELVGVGEAAVPSIERFIRSEKKALTFPIRALLRIRSQDEAKAMLVSALQQYEPLDHRITQAKVALVDALGDLLTPGEAEVLVPYIDDHHDDVQASVIEALERLSPKEVGTVLARVCGSELHSGRIKRHAAKTLVSLEVSIRPNYESFDPELKQEFLLGKKGQLVSRMTKSRPFDES